RPAGGAFGLPETLDDKGMLAFDSDVEAGIGADGGAVALWGRTVASGRSARTTAMASIAAPGAPFGAPARVAPQIPRPTPLAVAPDGRALAVVQDDDGVGVAERPPGGAFGPVTNVGPRSFGLNPPAVALRGDGAALIAWGGDDEMTGVGAVRRPGPGAFG